MERKIKHEERPWGEFFQLSFNEISTSKVLVVEPYQRLSLQSHQKRDELWMAICGKPRVENNGKVIFLKQFDTVLIPAGSEHRLSAHEDKVVLIEVSFGEFDENDEVRHEDDYNREKNPA
ncbi:mannose-6-phosphate isomerase [Candidatus Parcubacteria bacterium]|nr:MAG: mannose-6-phosphate isomerase [Candidatus Parcubacteria bacterium]